MNVQVGGDIVLDILTGGVAVMTGALAFATFRLGAATRRSVAEAAEAVEAAQAEAEATAALVRETRRDRELEVQPLLILGDIQGTQPLGEPPVSVPTLQVRNIGRGPALTTRVVQRRGESVFWSEGFFVVPAGGSFPAPAPSNPNALLALGGRREAASVEPALVGPGDKDCVVVYCRDQLGNALRFRAETGLPPEIFLREHWLDETFPDEWIPDWLPALREPFDLRPADQRRRQAP